jgi:hypothetical protein
MTRSAVASIVLGVALAAATPAWATRPVTNPAGKPTGGNPNQPAPSPGHAAQETDQGVIQSLNGSTVLVKALDGSTLTVPVSQATHILVDGKVGTLADVKPGDVAVVRWKVGKAAQTLEAFDLSPSGGERLAVVKSVSASAVVVAGANGGSQTIHVNVRTRIYLDGRATTLHSIVAGDTLVLLGIPRRGKPAAELAFLSPG